MKFRKNMPHIRLFLKITSFSLKIFKNASRSRLLHYSLLVTRLSFFYLTNLIHLSTSIICYKLFSSVMGCKLFVINCFSLYKLLFFSLIVCCSSFVVGCLSLVISYLVILSSLLVTRYLSFIYLSNFFFPPFSSFSSSCSFISFKNPLITIFVRSDLHCINRFLQYI
jgi:hypothetical protein